MFVQLEDGIAYVAESGSACNDPGGSGSLARVPPRLEGDVIHAAELCPGECIFIELDAEVAPDEYDDDDVVDVVDLVDDAAA